MNSLEKSLATEFPADRQTRHLRIADARLAEIAATFAKYKDATAPALQEQFKRWSEFQQRRHEILERAIKAPESLDHQCKAIADLSYALEAGHSDREIGRA